MATLLIPEKRSLAIAFSFLTFFSSLPRPAAAQAPPTELNIVVVQGEGAINKVRQRVTTEPAIRVEDEQHRPVSGVAVVFTLPTEGPTGEFGNGSKTMTIMTDASGQAAVAGLKVNEYPGKLILHVSASYRGLTARTNITQFDEGPPVTKSTASSGGHGRLILILAVIGAAAAGGGAYFALHKNGSSSPAGSSGSTGSTGISLTPGSPTIIGPH